MNKNILLQLSDLSFNYERVTALVSILGQLMAEGDIEVCGLPENTVTYALCEIEEQLRTSNKALKDIALKEGV